jgi:hypothetical protein
MIRRPLLAMLVLPALARTTLAPSGAEANAREGWLSAPSFLMSAAAPHSTRIAYLERCTHVRVGPHGPRWKYVETASGGGFLRSNVLIYQRPADCPIRIRPDGRAPAPLTHAGPEPTLEAHTRRATPQIVIAPGNQPQPALPPVRLRLQP